MRGLKRLLGVCLIVCLILITDLVIGQESDFGTKVLPTDADIGRPLFDIYDKISIGYWDTGTPGYDENDVVYLHLAPDGYNRTRANDVRLTSFENHSAGSKVTPYDHDINKPLTPLMVSINYLDSHGGKAYDLNDPVYIHQNRHFNDEPKSKRDQTVNMINYIYMKKINNIPSPDGFDIRLPNRANLNLPPGVIYLAYTDGYNLAVSDQSLEKSPENAGYWQGYDVEVIHCLKADYYHALNTWFTKIVSNNKSTPYSDNIGADGNNIEATVPDQYLCTGDIRISATDQQTSGTKVLSFDVDQNEPVAFPNLVSFPGRATDLASIKYYDVNGDGIYDYADDVYLNFPKRGPAGIVTVNSIRLSGSGRKNESG